MRSPIPLDTDTAFVKSKRRAAHLRLFELILSAVLGALTFALKVAMAALPNIHPVALMLLLCTLVFSWRAFVSCGIYIVMEGIFFGFSTWWIPYLYTWPLFVLLILLFKKRKNPFFWATFAGIFGFLFGFFFLPVNYFVYDMANHPELILPYILNDLPFNAIHAVSNFIIVLVLLPPLKKGMEMALKRIYHK